MRYLLSLIFVVCIGHTATSQNVMHLENKTGCDLMISLFIFDSGTCAFIGNANYLVPAGTTSVVAAPAGQEYSHAEVTSFPYCAGGVAFDISTPQNCYSTCPGYVANWYVGTNSGCNGCQPTINAKWNDCYDVNEGILTIIDF